MLNPEGLILVTMIDLNPERATIARNLQRIENEIYAQEQNQLLPYGAIDIEQATDNVLEQLRVVNAEPTERYRLLRLREIYGKSQTDDFRTFILADDEDRNNIAYQLEHRYQSLTARYFFTQVVSSELYPAGVDAPQFDDLEELKTFNLRVYNDAIIREWTYQDWELGTEFIEPETRRKSQVWGVTTKPHSTEYREECGKRYRVDYISEAVANEINKKQKEIGERYVAGNLEAYQSHYQKVAGQPPYTIPTLDDLRALYKRAATETSFAAAILPAFTNAGKQKAVARGAKFAIGPRRWFNEWLDWYTWIGGNEYQQYYHYVRPSMIDARNARFVQGDAEALFRFCNELDRPTQGIPNSTTGQRDRIEEYQFVLKEFISNEDNTPFTDEQYTTVAKQVAAQWHVDKLPRSYKSDRTNYAKGKPWITQPLIDQIINELQSEGQPVDYSYVRSIRMR